MRKGWSDFFDDAISPLWRPKAAPRIDCRRLGGDGGKRVGARWVKVVLIGNSLEKNCGHKSKSPLLCLDECFNVLGLARE